MPENPEPRSPGDDLWAEWLKPRRWLEFFRRIVTVELTLTTLKAETTALQLQVQNLDSEIKELQASLRVLLPTIAGLIDDKVRIAALEIVPTLVEQEMRRLDRDIQRS